MRSETPRVLAGPDAPAEAAPAVPAPPAQPGDASAGIEVDWLAPVLSLIRRRPPRPADGDVRRRGMADHPARAD
jgi:hypothetical protein